MPELNTEAQRFLSASEHAPIELVLQPGANDELAVRSLVKEVSGIEVLGIDSPDIFERSDLDALLLNSWMAGEYFANRGPRVPSVVTMDDDVGTSMHVVEAVISSSRDPRAVLKVPAPWIVSFAALPVMPLEEREQGIGGGGSATRRTDPTDDDKTYAMTLDTLEVIERHNASSVEPKIHRAGLQVGPSWIPGLLRAYRTYCARLQAGRYG